MKKVLFYLLFFPTLLVAQINESDSLKLKANLSLTGMYQDGNVETLIFRTNSEITYKPWRKWVFKTKNSYVYQAFGGDKADEDILSLNFLYLNPERKIYPFVLGFVSTNFRREIDIRSLFGAGVTFNILNKKKKWLKLSLSSEYEQTKFSKTIFNIAEYNNNNAINTFRGTIWVNGQYHLFKDKLVLKHESFYQPSLEASNNYRWLADFSLELPIWKFLNFKVNYRYASESIVVQSQKRDDQFLTFGFTIKNY